MKGQMPQAGCNLTSLTTLIYPFELTVTHIAHPLPYSQLLPLPTYLIIPFSPLLYPIYFSTPLHYLLSSSPSYTPSSHSYPPFPFLFTISPPFSTHPPNPPARLHLPQAIKHAFLLT